MSETEAGDLSEYDFMELVAFGSKVEHEGYDYASHEYAPRLERDDYQPTDRDELAYLWAAYRTAIDRWWDEHPDDGVELHNAHVDEAVRRREERCLWAVRYEGGGAWPTETKASARLHFGDDRARELLHRDAPGGEWTVVESRP